MFRKRPCGQGEIPIPQGWIEFDVEDIDEATTELSSRGYQLLVAGEKGAVGQIVTRVLGPEGLLVGVTHSVADDIKVLKVIKAKGRRLRQFPPLLTLPSSLDSLGGEAY